MQSLEELMERGYEDTYRQFIEPFLGRASRRIAISQPEFAPPTQTQRCNRDRSSAANCDNEASHQADSRRRRRRYRRDAVADDADLRDEHVRLRLGRRRHQVPGRQAERLPLLPLREPDRRRGGAEAGGRRRRRGVAAVQQRHGGDLDGAPDAAEERRRDPVLQRDLRRHLSHHRRPPAAGSASPIASSRSTSSRTSDR